MKPTHWLVLAPCGEGVLFPEERDALWTLHGYDDTDGFGYPTIGAEFRDAYGDEELRLIPLDLAQAAPLPGDAK